MTDIDAYTLHRSSVFHYGPRWALGVGVAACFGAAIVGVRYLMKHRHLRPRIAAGRLRFSIDEP